MDLYSIRNVQKECWRHFYEKMEDTRVASRLSQSEWEWVRVVLIPKLGKVNYKKAAFRRISYVISIENIGYAD